MNHRIKKYIRISTDALNNLREVGRLMSNLCYNFSQDSWTPTMTPHDKKIMAELCRRFDAADGRIRNEMEGKP